MPGKAELRITRRATGDEIAEALVPRMRFLGQAVGARVQRGIPKRTWAAHDTVDATTARAGSVVTTRVTVGSKDVPYPILLERGTSRMAAQPFMRPAFAQISDRDLNYSGRGIVRHGVISTSTRRSRTRARRQAKGSK